MKILVSRSSAGGIGGGERSALDYAYCFQKLGHEVVLVSSLAWVRNRASETGIPSQWTVWPNKYGGLARILHYLLVLPMFWLQCIYFVLRYRPDVINPQSRDDWIAFTLLKPLHKRPVIWRDPADLRHFLEEKPQSLFGRFNRRLLLKSLRSVDYILTLNDEERDIVLDRAGSALTPDRIGTVSSSIIYEEYELNAKPPKQTNRIVFGTTSLLRDHKGIQFAIEAFKRLQKKHDNLEFWIVGDGPYLPELKKLADGDPHIIFWGFVDEQSPYLARMDIFLMPALYEGWGRSLKEAQYFGIPTVGSNVGGIALQIEDEKTGLLIDVANVNQLEEQMDRLVSDKKLRKNIGQAGRKKALSDGDYVDLVREKILPIIEEKAQADRVQ